MILAMIFVLAVLLTIMVGSMLSSLGKEDDIALSPYDSYLF